jgi:hypothetical protein
LNLSHVVLHTIVYVRPEKLYISLSESLLPLPLSFLTAFPSSLREWTLPPAIANQGNDSQGYMIVSFIISLSFMFHSASVLFSGCVPHPISGARQDLPILQTGRVPVEIRTCQISHSVPHSVPRRTRYCRTRSISHDRLFAWPLGLSTDGYWRVRAKM